MGALKETRFSVIGVKHDGEEHIEKSMVVWLIEDDGGRKTVCLEFDGNAYEFPLDEIVSHCIQRQEKAASNRH